MNRIKCENCGGHGMYAGFGNEPYECKECEGSGARLPIVLISGSREHKDRTMVMKAIDDVCIKHKWMLGEENDNWLPDIKIVHGANPKGVDQFADDYAVVNFCDVQPYKANWNKYGKAAGPIRNQEMLLLEEPDVVLAFPTASSIGTWDMVERVLRLNKKGWNIELHVIGENGQAYTQEVIETTILLRQQATVKTRAI